RAPGDSVLLSCHGTGFTFENHIVRWYRQVPGAKLEWVSAIRYDSTITEYEPSVQSRATVSQNNSQSKAFLSLRALNPHDSACYFCAVDTEMGNAAELEHK
ncbi:HV01 protein, partial [Ceuthmochares aereus]|nr:HV01 protein [Ceuthmochares aereus]